LYQFGRNAIITANKLLFDLGFIDIIDNVPNSKGGKSVNHILFKVDIVNERLKKDVEQRLKIKITTFENKHSQRLKLNDSTFKSKRKEDNTNYNKEDKEEKEKLKNFSTPSPENPFELEKEKEGKEKSSAKKESDPDEVADGGSHVGDKPRTAEQAAQIDNLLNKKEKLDIETKREYLSGVSMRTDFAKILNSDEIYMDSWKETLNGYFIPNESDIDKQALREWVLKILGQLSKNIGSKKISPIEIYREVLGKVGWAANEIKTDIESLKKNQNVKSKSVVLS
jgi:hypothetical protein